LLLRVSVQVEDPGAVKLAGEQDRLESTGAVGFRVRLKVLVTAFIVAEITGVVTPLTEDAAVAEKVAVLEPDDTVTDAGTIAAALPLLSETDVLPVALLLKVAVQVEDPGAVKLAGEQERLESTGVGGFRVRLKVLVTALIVAEITGVITLLTEEDAVAEKVAVLEPDDTVTDAGTVAAALPLLSETDMLPVALLLKVAVQVEEPGAVKLAGEQVRLERTGATGWLIVTVPPLPVIVKP
jgi:hypothetical protein